MPRRVRPKKKTSPQGQENMSTNAMDEDDREDAAARYQHRELVEIRVNADKALKKAEEAYEAAKLKADELHKNARAMSHEEYKRKMAQLERREMLQDMPSLPKLRKKTKSVPKSVRSKRTRKHKTL
jgi:hypothetical protein